MNQKLRLRSSLAAAALAATFAGSALAQTPAARRRRAGARTRLDLHRQRRPVQPVRVPRHFANQREAGAPGRLRPRAQERLLRRHVGVEHLVAVRRQPRRLGVARVGLLRRLQVAAAGRTSSLDLGVLYYWYPGHLPDGLQPSPTPPSSTPALTWKWLHGASTATAVEQHVRLPRFATAPTTGSSTRHYDVVDKVNDYIGKVTLFGHVGKQKFKNNGFYDYGDWKVGVLDRDLWA